MPHGFTVRSARTGRVSYITVRASSREIAAAWIDRNPDLSIVARIARRS